MSATALNSTTLSAALNDTDNNFAVASTTNISAGDLLVVRGEAMKVNAVDDPASGYVKVVRGVNGTEPRPALSGQRVWIGSPEKFIAIKANAAKLGLSGNSGTLPDYLLPGARATDDAGNEYVMVDSTTTIYGGATVLISHDGLFSASVLASGNAGSVGIIMEQASSDEFTWAQIYGYCPYAQLVGGSSLMTSTGVLTVATSVSTPAVGLKGGTTSQASSVEALQIRGMFPASATTTATTSASSAVGYYAAVWLNYPFLMRTVSS